MYPNGLKTDVAALWHMMKSVWVDLCIFYFFDVHLQYFMLLKQDTDINNGQTWEFE